MKTSSEWKRDQSHGCYTLFVMNQNILSLNWKGVTVQIVVERLISPPSKKIPMVGIRIEINRSLWHIKERKFGEDQSEVPHSWRNGGAICEKLLFLSSAPATMSKFDLMWGITGTTVRKLCHRGESSPSLNGLMLINFAGVRNMLVCSTSFNLSSLSIVLSEELATRSIQLW